MNNVVAVKLVILFIYLFFNLICTYLFTVTSVSYTHLDVYKRQRTGSNNKRNPSLIQTVLSGSRIMSFFKDSLRFSDILTVSYTHLDVYKRQVIVCPLPASYLPVFKLSLTIFWMDSDQYFNLKICLN